MLSRALSIVMASVMCVMSLFGVFVSQLNPKIRALNIRTCLTSFFAHDLGEIGVNGAEIVTTADEFKKYADKYKKENDGGFFDVDDSIFEEKSLVLPGVTKPNPGYKTVIRSAELENRVLTLGYSLVKNPFVMSVEIIEYETMLLEVDKSVTQVETVKI